MPGRRNGVKVTVGGLNLYRTVNSKGHTIDFIFAPAQYAGCIPLSGENHEQCQAVANPLFINTDKAPTYGRVVSQLKRESRCSPDLKHRQIKYRNNLTECHHGKLGRIKNPELDFKSIKTAYATLKGIEVMRSWHKGQAESFYSGHLLGEMHLVNRKFEGFVMGQQARRFPCLQQCHKKLGRAVSFPVSPLHHPAQCASRTYQQAISDAIQGCLFPPFTAGCMASVRVQNLTYRFNNRDILFSDLTFSLDN